MGYIRRLSRRTSDIDSHSLITAKAFKEHSLRMTRDGHGSDVSYAWWTILPATIVATVPPLKLRPSKGELRDLLAESFTL
jgi:hypothetical protein